MSLYQFIVSATCFSILDTTKQLKCCWKRHFPLGEHWKNILTNNCLEQSPSVPFDNVHCICKMNFGWKRGILAGKGAFWLEKGHFGQELRIYVEEKFLWKPEELGLH